MDDDFSFASVWGAPASATPSPLPSHPTLAPPPIDFPPSSSSSQGDDDFDDFGTARTEPSDAMDDDFGDFGDFGDVDDMPTPTDFDGFGQDVHIISPLPPVQEPGWDPLRLDPFPSRAELQAQLDEILGSVWTDDISLYTTADDIREVEGISQILVTPERYATLISRLMFLS